MAKRTKKKKSSPEVARTQAQRTSPLDFVATYWKQLLQAMVIVAATWWIYGPVLHGDWLWDDDAYIINNPLLHDPARLWKIWFKPGSIDNYFPITTTVQWVQWELWGKNTFGYHLTNVFLHIVSSLLVWRLFSKFGLQLAWLGGLIFAIHPVQVESVAWIVELKNTLSLPPFLLAMCAWVDYEEHKRKRDYFLALGFFLAAMLCKTTMVMFPMVILLYAWWKRDRIGWHDLKLSVPFFVISLGLGVITVLAERWYSHASAGNDPSPLGNIYSRLACAGLVISFYFSKVFLPVDLLPIYPKWPIDPPSLIQFLPWPVFLGMIYWLWTRHYGWNRQVLLGLGFFLINLLPFIGFIPTGIMWFTWVMNHYLYIPIIGLIGLVVAGLGQVDEQLPRAIRPYGIGIVSVVMALFVWESRSYAGMFIDEEVLWKYTVQRNPEAYIAHNNLGYALLQKGLVSEAMKQFEATLRIKPDYVEAHHNLGIALAQTGRISEAIDQYGQALRINPDIADVHVNLGIVLVQTGRMSEAIDQYKQALRIKPYTAEAHNNLGNVLLQIGRTSEAIDQINQALRIKPDMAEAHFNLGIALAQIGRVPEAMEQYEQALRIKPDYAEAHFNLGNALFQMTQTSKAIDEYEQAVRLKPDFAEAHFNLGIALAQTGRVSEAMKEYEQALRIKPDYAEAHFNLGIALAQTGRVSEVMKEYEQALRIKPDYAEAHLNLGTALAQTGRVSEAMKEYEQALRIKPDFAQARNNLTQLQALEKTAPVKK